MLLLVHRHEEQLRELATLVQRHGAAATDIIRRAYDLDQLLRDAKSQLARTEREDLAFREDLTRLDTALRELEKATPNLGSAEGALSGWKALAVDRDILPEASLGGVGPTRDPDELVAELLSPEELERLRTHLDRPMFERLRWTKGDYLVCAGCALLGMALELVSMAWRNGSPIDTDGSLRKWLNEDLHSHASSNPIDYQGAGFGGPLHRVRSRGHDLARFLGAINHTARGEFRGVRWAYGTPHDVISQANQFGTSYPQMGWTAAFVNVAVHLFADFFSTHSLPLPLSSVVYENADRELRTFVHQLYEGGFNLRHVAIGSVEAVLVNLGIETWLWLQHGGVSRQPDAVALKRYEMRAAVGGILSGANVAGCVLFKNPFLLNVPVIIATLDASVRLLQLRAKQRSWVLMEERNLAEVFAAWDALAAEVDKKPDLACDG